MTTPRKVVLSDILSGLDAPWTPKVAAELNGQHVRVARLEGPFVWHDHAGEDELFLVLDGALDLEFRDGVVHLGPGELAVVPRGVEHRPVARPTASVLLFEPAATVNTGDLRNEFTVERPEQA